jgi:hypothetical protein
MTRLEKCEYLKSKGYKYDPETGIVIGLKKKHITKKNSDGYILLYKDLYAHHFAWYMTYGNVDFIELDHKNQNPSDNRITNLRIVNHQQNAFNRSNVKGYTWDKTRNKWRSSIFLNRKRIYLGQYDTEEEARQAYLKAKEKYHLI